MSATCAMCAKDSPHICGKRAWLLAIATAAIAFIVFLPTLTNQFVDWDDTGVLTENENYRGLTGEHIAWMFTTNHYGHYQPITWLTYGVDYVLWGMNPTGYHLTNNLFHAANTLLVFFLALGLLGRARGDAARAPPLLLLGGATLAALLFAVHPLRVESVAWATERRDLVSAFFLLLTVLAYLRSTRPGEPCRGRWLMIAIGVYVISMLSKVGGAPLPVVLMVLDWYPLRRFGRDRIAAAPPLRTVLVEKIPFWLVAIGFAASTVAQQSGKWLVPLAEHGLTARTAQAFYGLEFYLLKTVVPTNLLPLYEMRWPLDPFEPRFVVAAAAVLAVAAVAFGLRRRVPSVAAAALCYAAMLGPLLGYFQNGPQIVADRYSYLSCVGWTVLAAGAVGWFVRDGTRGRIAAALAVSVGVVITLGVLTWRQCGVWHDTASLWSYVVARDPGGSYANNSYGFVLLTEQRRDEAVLRFEQAIAIKPRNSEAYYNLWTALAALGREADLRAAYVAAVDAPVPEVQASARFRLGNIALRVKRNEEAVGWYRAALAVREPYAIAHANLGLVLVRLERIDEALGHYTRAVELKPDLVNAHYGLARVYARLERYDEAVAEIRIVIELDPDHSGAGALLSRVEGLRRSR